VVREGYTHALSKVPGTRAGLDRPAPDLLPGNSSTSRSSSRSTLTAPLLRPTGRPCENA